MDENVLLVYFNELSKTMQPSTLWSRWSMIKKTLNLNHGININSYEKLKTFMKNNSKGHMPKKAAVLTWTEINTFLQKAPDNIYLAAKVILIFGSFGALRSNEFCDIKIQDVQETEVVKKDDDEDPKKQYIIEVRNTKNCYPRQFIIGPEYYDLVKSYATKRPKTIEHNRFFIYYKNNICTTQVIGKNKFSEIPKTVALYLGLRNPEKYTGHSFRRTSATLVANTGANLTTLKQHGGWRSSTVAEGYIEHSLRNKENIYQQIIDSNKPSTSTASRLQSTATREPLKEKINDEHNRRKTESPTNENHEPSPPAIEPHEPSPPAIEPHESSPVPADQEIIIPETPENDTEPLTVNINNKKRTSETVRNNTNKRQKLNQKNHKLSESIDPHIHFHNCEIQNITINFNKTQ